MPGIWAHMKFLSACSCGYGWGLELSFYFFFDFPCLLSCPLHRASLSAFISQLDFLRITLRGVLNDMIAAMTGSQVLRTALLGLLAPVSLVLGQTWTSCNPTAGESGLMPYDRG